MSMLELLVVQTAVLQGAGAYCCGMVVCGVSWPDSETRVLKALFLVFKLNLSSE